MSAMRRLVGALVEPGSACALGATGWAELWAVARAERLAGSLALRLGGCDLPPPVVRIVRDELTIAGEQRRAALWEVDRALAALTGLTADGGQPVQPILLKGSAYLAAGLRAGDGRHVGDLDILLPRALLDPAEVRLIAAGWEWVKPDDYDDAYYRRWMHELPPLIHRDRGRMIDVHHSILPLTARPSPDAEALIEAARPLSDGGAVLAPADMLVHAAAHLFADGELAGGLRNLWDIHALLSEFVVSEPGFWTALEQAAAHHQLLSAVGRAVRLSHTLFATEVPERWQGVRGADRLFMRRMLARDGWGRPTRPALRLGFYLRGHWLRMPPGLLARHLLVKASRRQPATRSSAASSSS